ncbi:MAG: serine hydrolase [Chloroflexi bacterium]|nr:serine hydrolase [Chloroflexota bacterium]
MASWEQALDPVLQQGLDRVYTAAVVQVRHRGRAVYHRAVGWPDPEAAGEQVTTRHTLFDLASITKPFVATAFLHLVARTPELGLNTPVAAVLPEFQGLRPVRAYPHPLQPGYTVQPSRHDGLIDAAQVTFQHVLTHSAGLPAWTRLYTLEPEALRATVLGTPFAYPPGQRVIYSDVGFMILGWAVEALAGRPLDQAVHALVLEPLGLRATGYRPAHRREPLPPGAVAATEACPWRGRRVRGEVHDENAWRLGGVAGHAGLFSTAAEVAAFGQAWLDATRGHGPLAELLGPDLARQAVQLQAAEGPVRRGLGWALWSPAPRSASHPLGPRTFGHTGFTGTSLFVDPDCDLVIAALTNRVYFGRDSTPISDWRLALHQEAKALCSSLG